MLWLCFLVFVFVCDRTHYIHKNVFVPFSLRDAVAEWLRRSTRNRLGLSRVGSSPAGVETSFLLQSGLVGLHLCSCFVMVLTLSKSIEELLCILFVKFKGVV